MMALMTAGLRKRVVFCPRSGLILDDIERSPVMRWFVSLVQQRSDMIVWRGQS